MPKVLGPLLSLWGFWVAKCLTHFPLLACSGQTSISIQTPGPLTSLRTHWLAPCLSCHLQSFLFYFFPSYKQVLIQKSFSECMIPSLSSPTPPLFMYSKLLEATSGQCLHFFASYHSEQ